MKRVRIIFLLSGIVLLAACKDAKPQLSNAQSKAVSVMKDRSMVTSALVFTNEDNGDTKLDSLSLEFSVNGKPSGKSRATKPELDRDFKTLTLNLISAFNTEEVLSMEDKSLIGKLFSKEGVTVKINIKGTVFMTKDETTYEVPVDYTANVNLSKNTLSE